MEGYCQACRIWEPELEECPECELIGCQDCLRGCCEETSNGYVWGSE